jgi:hypothetical protein
MIAERAWRNYGGGRKSVFASRTFGSSEVAAGSREENA